MMANVHFLEFSQSNNPANDWDRLRVLWHLDVSQPPRLLSDESGGESSSSEEWRGILEGDLVVFPSLLSGAGEFEQVRFVGPKSTDDQNVLPLLTAGIEYPEFPTLIVSMAEERGVSLRKLYEKPFDLILASQPPKMTLLDLFGRDEVGYNEFWTDVPVARRRRPPSGDPWKFSLGVECNWIRTLVGEPLTQNRDEEL